MSHGHAQIPRFDAAEVYYWRSARKSKSAALDLEAIQSTGVHRIKHHYPTGYILFSIQSEEKAEGKN